MLDKHEALELIAHSSNCEGGSCPTVWRDRATNEAVIRGYLPDGSEIDVRHPWSEFMHLVSQIPR